MTCNVICKYKQRLKLLTHVTWFTVVFAAYSGERSMPPQQVNKLKTVLQLLRVLSRSQPNDAVCHTVSERQGVCARASTSRSRLDSQLCRHSGEGRRPSGQLQNKESFKSGPGPSSVGHPLSSLVQDFPVYFLLPL